MFRMIRGGMGDQNCTRLVLWLILFSGFLVVTLEENIEKDETFLSQFMAPPSTGQVNTQMVGTSWSQRCWQDSDCVKEAVAAFNLCFPGLKDNTELFGLNHSHLKQTLLDCIQEKGKLNGHNPKYLELLSSMVDTTPRRNLATRPGSSPSPSPSPPPPRPPKRNPGPPTRSRSPPPRRSSFPPSRSPPPPPPKKNVSKTPKSAPVSPAKKKEDHQKTIIIAVVVTAVSTFLLAALFFLCCTRVCGNGSGGRKNDERPLLSLSSSDYSVGSSINYGGSVKGEKPGHQSYNIYSNQGKMSSSFDGSNSDDSYTLEERISQEGMHNSSITNHGMPPLKPPPGRTASALSGKSLSGKVEPLPPEPPKFLKVSSKKSSAPAPAPAPPMPSSVGPPRPPPPAPPPGSGGPRPPPPPGLKGPRPPPPMSLGPKAPRPSSGPAKASEDDGPSKTKLKPFFWDKVQANPEHSMVWNDIRSGSFQFNEEMIESLFGYAAADKNKNDKKGSSGQVTLPQFIQILEPKKGQNLSILLRALNATTEEMCDALREGNELPVEFIQTLLKMAPTPEEELKLRLYCGEIAQLGTAERFLKAVVDIPFAFKRLEALLFMCTLHEEMAFVKESFQTLEVACKELRGSRLFLKLLEAVLKTGNRMNDGTFRGGAQAFKLDTLLKLSDVKGTDGKTTLLQFVVQEIIRTEGLRAARTIRESQSFSSVKTEDLLAEETTEEAEENYRNLGLQKVSGLSSELENVKKSANIDADGLTGTVLKMGHALSKARDFVNSEMKSSGEESGFREALEDFIQNAEGSIVSVLEEEKRIMALVKSTGDYFHGKAGKDEGLRLFVIVRDFLIILDKSCKEVREARGRPVRMARKQGSTASSASETPRQPPSVDPRQKLFPAISERRMDHSSSDSD
ncbi:PREDICTED: formin-like protein 5 [Camelina sativa]|uniref:Formin-like protein n=1 Tax=Camelina sativa TaxID=90675 RepID=A0ABM0ULU4_CAMSA|nr:PREDICTED: formin-like protein 5 [Camelina sativa]